jgi:hypothetical protein
MYVERKIGNGVDLLDNVETEADVGYVNAVHDVAVEHIGAGLFGAAEFVFQMQEVGSQKRGSNFHFHKKYLRCSLEYNLRRISGHRLPGHGIHCT